MSAQKAYELCPSAIFKPGNYQKYSEISQEIREIFRRYTDVIEPVSIDEAYLDVTENKVNSKSAIKIAKMIQYDIWHELQLTCSAVLVTISFSQVSIRFSETKGPDGCLTRRGRRFLKALPIEDFHGIGKKQCLKCMN